MKKLINIGHSFLRIELDNSIVLILDYQNEWHEKDIKFNIKDNYLQISVDNQLLIWQTKLTNQLLIQSLMHKNTAVIINGGNNGISEGIITPFISLR